LNEKPGTPLDLAVCGVLGIGECHLGD